MDDDDDQGRVGAFAFDLLQPWPDDGDPNAVAVDASDRLILDEAAASIRAAPRSIVVIGDHFGALTLGAIALHGATGVRVHQDGLTSRHALAFNAAATGLADRFESYALDADLLSGAKVVLLQLPKALAALQEIAEAIARHADPDVVVFAGGRVKHMTTGMNEVLRGCFTDVRATLGRQKSRVLVAAGAKPGVPSTFPRREWHSDLDLWVYAHGAAFGGTKIDLGTRFLLGYLERMSPRAATAVDLGCGTGVLAVALARARPDLSVLATDDSAAAVDSATATMRANGQRDRVQVIQDDAMSTMGDSSADLVVCNPPFHVGAGVSRGAATRLFVAAGRLLRPGGEMWTVFNRHLTYGRQLDRLVGPTRVVGRNPKFTVTLSTGRERRNGRSDRP